MNDELIDIECGNCGETFTFYKLLKEKEEKDGGKIFCSAGCRHQFETGNNPEEY